MASGASESAARAAPYLSAVETRLRASDMAGAALLSEDAVMAGAEHPTLLLLAGLRRLRGDDVTGALALLERARDLSPQHPGILDGIGQCLTRLGRGREAVAVFDIGLHHGPMEAPLHFNRAMALEEIGAMDQARSGHERTVELQPRHGDALARLATLAVQRGDSDAARDWAGRALAVNPRDPVARIALAMAELARQDYAAAETQLQALLQLPGLAPVNLSIAHSLAGDLLDAQDKPAEAFNAYAAAKAELRGHYAAQMAAIPEMPRAREQRLAAYFRAAAPEAWRVSPGAADGVRHVFLLGFPRSGTTLLEQVLAGHPDVEAMEEQPCLMDAAAEFFGSDAGLDRLAALSDKELDPWRAAYWRRAGEAGHAAARPVFLDKMPLNTPFLPLIAKLFPRAKILFALRDPRDVVLSCFRRRFGMNMGMYEFTTLQGAGAYYDAVMDLMQVYEERLGLDMRRTHHERLVADFSAEAASLCDFLGLDFNDGMRGFALRARAQNINTPSSAQLAGGLSTNGIGQWRRYRQAMTPVLPILGAWAARFGYSGD